MNKSDFLENTILNHVLRNTAYTPSTSIEVYLFTTLPDETGANGVEVAGGGYVRQTVSFAAASGGMVVNQGAVTFPQATVAWGSVVGVGLYANAGAGGQLLYFGALTAPKVVEVGDQLSFAVGSLMVSEA